MTETMARRTASLRPPGLARTPCPDCPAPLQLGAAAASGGAAAPRGRVLRLKLGYNPNSSSIGTIVFAMPAALLGVTVALGAAAALLTSAFVQHAGGAAAGPEHDAPPPSDDDVGWDRDDDA